MSFLEDFYLELEIIVYQFNLSCQQIIAIFFKTQKTGTMYRSFPLFIQTLFLALHPVDSSSASNCG